MHEKIESTLDLIENTKIKIFTRECLRRIHVDFITAPASTGNHHAWYGGLLDHSCSVAELCGKISDHFISLGLKVNKSVAIAGGLLQDIGKIDCYEATPKKIIVDRYGTNIEASEYKSTYKNNFHHHIPVGYHFAASAAEHLNLEDDEDINHVLHLIISHHGRMEWHSPVVPKTVEALICHSADMLDAYVTASPEYRKKFGL